MKAAVFCLTTILLLIQITENDGQPQNLTSNIPQDGTVDHEKTPGSTNQTNAEPAAPKTEDVLKISADQNSQPSSLEYPVVTKLEPDYSAEVKRQIEKLSLEELKLRCQHLSRLFQESKTTTASSIPTNHNIVNTATKPNNHKPYEPNRRPVYFQPKPTYKPKYPTTTKANGFYITQSSVTPKPIANTNTNTPPVKYIRLEPVILQKTILSDGRTVYFWHRSLPSAVELAGDINQNNQLGSAPEQTYPHYYQYGQPHVYGNGKPLQYVYGNGNNPYRYGQLSQNSYGYGYVAAQSSNLVSTEDSLGEGQKISETSTESSTTSTTEQSSYGYGLGSFLPFYSYSATTTSTEPSTTTTTTTTTPEPTTPRLKPDDLLYAQQLKFIIPVPYDGANGQTPVKRPWDFDQYAYYPKELQPDTVKVEVPYTPTFHMIRAVAVPNSVSKLNGEANQK